MTTTLDAHAPAISGLLGLYTETALHAGTGQSTGAIDLPIERERHTHFPIVHGSSLKGSLRALAERSEPEGDLVTQMFGPEEGELYAGALSVGEAQIVAFPVRGSQQVFVWATCPLVLDRLARLAGATWSTPTPRDEQALASGEFPSESAGGLLLEDLSFTVRRDAALDKIGAWIADTLLPAEHAALRQRFVSHLLVIPDADFTHLARNATTVAARIKLNKKKTTSGNGGNLWYEETLPRDCVFVSALSVGGSRKDVNGASRDDLAKRLEGWLAGAQHLLQVGGNETVGHGWCALRWTRLGDGGQTR